MKTLLSATVNMDGQIEATYERVTLGAASPTRKNDKWSEAALNAGKNLIKVANDLSPDDPEVKSVQVYGSKSGGATEHSAAGEVVDVQFTDNTGARAGETAAVPSNLASARDAFKQAVSEAL